MVELIKRDAFLYLETKDSNDEFAQCRTCFMWLDGNRCLIHAEWQETAGDDSCGFYVEGEPLLNGEPMGLVTAKESGLVSREVRCENCVYGEGTTCELYERLNKAMPHIFDLDTQIELKACCNAQTPR